MAIRDQGCWKFKQVEINDVGTLWFKYFPGGCQRGLGLDLSRKMISGRSGPDLWSNPCLWKHRVDEGGEKEAVIMIRLEANNGSLKTEGKRWLMGKTGLRSSQVELREGAWLSRSSLTLTFTKCSALMDLAPEGSPQNHFCKVLLIYSSQWTFSVRLKLCVISVLWPIEVLVKGP